MKESYYVPPLNRHIWLSAMMNGTQKGHWQVHKECNVRTFAISLPSQPFLGCHHGFHIFFYNGLLYAGLHTFYSWAFWIRLMHVIIL